MRRRRRWEEEELEERERPAKPQLAQLDEGTRAGVLEELQRAGGNNAVQRVVGAQLQRDPTTAEKPTTSARSFAPAAMWLLSIDGTIVGAVPSVSGCGARTQVVVEPAGPGGVANKRIAGLEYEPCVLKVGLGMGKGLFDWIGDATSQKDVRKNLTLHQVDVSGNEGAQLEINDAMVTSIGLPRLAADDTSGALLTVTIAPEAVKRRAGSGQKLDSKLAADPLLPSTVRFEVSGIGQVAGLRSVEPWLFEQKTVEDWVGTGRQREKSRTTKALGNLVVTLSESGKKSGVAGFDAWFEEFAIKGNTGDERTATLTVSSKGGRTLRLDFSGVGIMAADQIGRADGGRRYELYVESVKISGP
jgi:phage tail-like protein